MNKLYPPTPMGQVGGRRIRGPLVVLALLTALSGGPLTHAQSPGGITTAPSVWYKPDGATTAAWTDASGNNINLSTNGSGAVTVNAGDAAHNFHSWTTGYSSANYYLYTSNTNALFGAYGDTAGGYRYTPLTVLGAARATSAANGAITGLDNDVSYGAEPGFGVQASGGTLRPRSYRFGNGYNEIAASQQIQLRQTSVYLYQPPPGNASAGTGNLIFGLNGTQSVTSGVSARSSVAGPHLNVGYDGFTFGAFPGDIQEVVWYKATLGANDISKVETYLALKYGTTLTHDYVTNSGTLYNLVTNTGYTANIAGIVRDDVSGLYQKQSNSVNTGKQVLISTTGLANTNAANTGTFSDGQALIWGDNDQAKIPSVSVSNIPGTNYRFAAVWKVQNTGTVGVVRVAWPSVWASIKLVRSSDPTFASGNTITDMTANTQTINGVTYNYADVTLTDGQYFTFAAFVQTPGGVALPVVWLKADAGTDTSMVSGRVNGWQNYGYSGGIAGQLSQSTGTTYDYPYFENNIHNFNPSLVDSTTNANGGLLLANVFPDYSQRALSTFVLQSQPDITQQRTMVSFGNNINFQSSNDYPWFASQSATQLYFWWDGSYQAAPVLPNSLKRYNNIPTINAYYRRQWTSNPDTTTLSMDGATTIITGNSSAAAGIGNHLYIHADGGNNNLSGGNISEIISYDRDLTSIEKLRINSYFSIKYGITLLNGNGLTVANYLNSAGDTVWHASGNNGYSNNIAGIAYDYNSGLNQKQSVSENAGKQVLIGTPGLANTNVLNTATLATDKQYLIWGDNGQVKSPGVAITGVAGANYRFNAIWKVQNTGTVGTVRVTWPKTWDNITLLRSADSIFDGSDIATNMSANTQTINGVVYNYADVTFTNGQYFTFAILAQSPGGIAVLPAVWYRPDNVSSSQWQDASINTLDLTSENGTTVKSGDRAHNFHSWTTNYSATKYYNYLDNSVSNTNLEINPVFGNYNVNGYSYTPLTVFGVARDTFATGGSGLITGMDNEKANASEPGFGVYGAQQRFYRFSYGAAASGGNVPINMSAVYMWRPTTGGAAASGTDTLLMGLNGAYSKSQMNKVGSVAGPYLKIGYSASDWGAFPGDIQEVIWYKDSLGYSDIRKVETYLALKYGTTLAHSYVAASGTTIYDLGTDSTYRYNIAGIGREDANGGLNQRQSNSVYTGNQVLISTTGLGNTNDSNAVQLTNAQYLVWGDNGRAKAPSVYMGNTFSNVNVRFKSVWKVQNTGSIGTVRVAWPADGLNNLSLIRSADTTFDASDAVTNMSANTQTINGVIYNYADVTLPNGQYFTFASKIDHAPGGVFTGLSYWYRADKNAVNTGDSTNATSWTDYASGTAVSQMGSNPYPLYRNGNAQYFNFNPGLLYTDGAQALGNMTVQTVADTSYDIFTLTKEGIQSGGANPRVFSSLVNNAETTGNIHYWDGIGLNADGNIERENQGYTLHYYANPGNINYANNSPSIMYNSFTNNAVSKGLNGARNGAAGILGPLNYLNGGHVFGSTQFSGNGSDNAGFKGSLGEAIIYGSNNLTSEERNKVDAYLAIKYGITLDTSKSYLTSGSAVVWDKNANKPYYNNVAGIGRDDLSALFQKQSRSQIINNANGEITIGLGDIYNTNLNNPDSIADGQFMIWGDNGNTQAMTNVATTYATFTYNGSSSNRRMKRTWKVQNTGVAHTVKLRFPVTSVGTTTLTSEDACTGYAIIYASDSGFTSGLVVAPLSTNGTNYEALNDFPQGASYFTFAKITSLAPGVVVLPDTAVTAPVFSACASNTWKYAKLGATTNKYFAISGMTPVQLNNLSVTITPTGGYYNGNGRETRLMSRVTTVNDASNGTYTGLKVRVYYSNTEKQNTSVANAQANNWIKYEGNAAALISDVNTDGVLNSGTATMITPDVSGVEDGVSFVDFYNVSSFSSFAFISSTETIGTVLPVTMISFTAERQGNTAILRWSTANEQRNKGFDIQHSADSKAWRSIGFVNSAALHGNSDQKLDYSYTDKAPANGMNYYRLKQTDFDGRYVYSVIRQLSFSNNSISVHPNPVTDYLTIDGLSGGESIKVYDAAGKMIKEIRSAQSSAVIDLSAFSQGSYNISITTANGTIVSRKVVKVN